VAGDPGLVAAFGGGMLSFLSPCVLPLVPGYISLISGVGVSELRDPSHAVDGAVAVVPRVVRPTLLFVAGFTAVFTALGASATAVGQALTEHQIGINRVAGALVFLMGLFLAGFVQPQAMLADRRFHVLPSRLGIWAPPVMGMAFAFGWTPCIGPILGGVLTLAQTQSTVGRGALLLVAYSLGLGVPFVLTGVAFGRLTGVFDWVKGHYRIINLVAGLALAAFGALLFLNRVAWLSQQLVRIMNALHLGFLTQI
jgi:cytochrome c-type biogenesis protein